MDTSVLIALLLEEDDAEDFRAKLDGADQLFVSAASVVETTIVYLRSSTIARPESISDLIASLGCVVAAVTAEQASRACEAYQRYGKGRHPAKLNSGDCFSYALAKSLDVPLLFKGEDFGLTDVRVA